MKNRRFQTVDSRKNLFFRPGEIEEICLEELRGVNLLPLIPEAIRIDRFIEKRFKVHFQFADLPIGILGFTKFGINGVEAIIVSSLLSDESTSTAGRRLNTTLAHEAGHALLHAGVFDINPNEPSLAFDEIDHGLRRILCREDGIIDGTMHVVHKNRTSYLEVHAKGLLGGSFYQSL